MTGPNCMAPVWPGSIWKATASGARTATGTAPELPPGAAGSVTVTEAAPTAAKSAGASCACSRAGEMKVVGSALPFHWAIEDELNCAPARVRVQPGPPARSDPGWTEARVKPGCRIAKGSAWEVPPPDPELEMLTSAPPAEARSEAGIWAVRWPAS